MQIVKRSTKPEETMTASRPEVDRLFDSLVGDVVLRHASGRRMLDLGHGRPEVTRWANRIAERKISQIPFATLPQMRLELSRVGDASHELVYSLDTFPHLDSEHEDFEKNAQLLLSQMARVTSPAGTVLVELANPTSLLRVEKELRAVTPSLEILETDSPTGRVLSGADTIRPAPNDEQGGTGSSMMEGRGSRLSYQTVRQFRKLCPTDLTVQEVYGAGFFTPIIARLQRTFLKNLAERAEWFCFEHIWLNQLATRTVVSLRKNP